MITGQRLASTDYGRGLLDFFTNHRLFKVTDWGDDNSDDKASNRPSDRTEVGLINEADVVGSARRGLMNGEARHDLVLDIDHPCWLIPSTTPGHYHLYVKLPGAGMSNAQHADLLTALANAGVIEWGYASASTARGWTSVRLPWIEKIKRKVPD